MTKLTSLLAASFIATVASSGAVFAADQNVTMYPASATGQQAYVEELQASAANAQTYNVPAAPQANATVYPVSAAGEQADADAVHNAAMAQQSTAAQVQVAQHSTAVIRTN